MLCPCKVQDDPGETSYNRLEVLKEHGADSIGWHGASIDGDHH